MKYYCFAALCKILETSNLMSVALSLKGLVTPIDVHFEKELSDSFGLAPGYVFTLPCAHLGFRFISIYRAVDIDSR